MLHGLAASHHDWDWLAPQVIQAGYQVFVPDLPGHGDSPRPRSPASYTLDYLYQALVVWMEQESLPEPFFLIGHSLGGYLSLKIAIERPKQVLGLVLAAPFYSLKQIFPLARHVLKLPMLSEQVLRLATPQMVDSILWFTAPVLGNYPSQARRQTALDYTRTIPASMRFPASAQDLSSSLASIEIPVLTVWGKHDLMLRPQFFNWLVKALPLAHGIAIPACGHEPHLAYMAEFNQLALDFIKAHTFDRQPDIAQHSS